MLYGSSTESNIIRPDVFRRTPFEFEVVAPALQRVLVVPITPHQGTSVSIGSVILSTRIVPGWMQVEPAGPER